LIKAGAEVVVLDNLFQGHRDAVHPTPPLSRGIWPTASWLKPPLPTTGRTASCTLPRYTLVGESMERPFLYLRDNITTA
jgi:UDP-glucose 4-epimerase